MRFVFFISFFLSICCSVQYSSGQITGNTIDADQTVCDGGMAFPLHGSTPLGGDGTYTYLWLSSTDSISWTAAPGPNFNIDYFFIGPLSGFPKYFFCRQVTSGSDTDTSNVVTITVLLGTPAINNNAIFSDQSVCWGEIPAQIGGPQPTGGNGNYYYLWLKSTDSTFLQPSFAGFNFQDQYLIFDAPLDDTYWFLRIVAIDSNYAQCPTASNPLKIDVYSIQDNIIGPGQIVCEGNTPMIISGPPPDSLYVNSYFYQWEQSTDSLNWDPAFGTNNQQDYYPPALYTTTYFRRNINASAGNGCGYLDTTSNNLKIAVNLPINGNTIAPQYTYACDSQSMYILPDGILSGGGGVYSFSWEISSDGLSWGPAPGTANLEFYETGPITGIIFFRRNVFSGGCTSISNVVQVLFNPAPAIANNSISIGGSTIKTICEGDLVGMIAGTSPTGGYGSGTYVFDWYRSYDGLTWEFLATGTQDYYEGIIDSTTIYSRTVASGLCHSASNHAVASLVSIRENFINSDQVICNGMVQDSLRGPAPPDLTTSSFIYIWQESTDAVNWIPAAGINNQQYYFPDNYTQLKFFRRIIQVVSMPCTGLSDTSNVVSVFISSPVVNNVIYPANYPDYSVCLNTSATLGPVSGPTGGDNNYTYLWQDSLPGGAWADAPGINDQFGYITSPLTQNTFYRRIVESCNYISLSNNILITIDPLPIYTFTIADSICSTESAEYKFNFQGALPWTFSFNDGTGNYSIGPISDYIYIDHFAPAVTTTYYIYNVIDGNGCISDQPGQNHTVGVFEMPAAMGSDTTICGLKTTDGSHCIIQSATGTGNWLPHPGISFSDLTNCQSDIYAIDYGFYDLTWSMNNVICDTFINVRFTFVEPPVPEKNYAGEPQHLDFKTATHLQGSLPDHFAGEWSVYKGHAIINDPGDPNSYVYDLSPGNNVFTWTIYGNGCDTKTDTTLVNINHRILMPEGFSPNGDGTNDLLVIRGIGDIFHAKLLVYNRWGGEVYFNEDYMNDWDGKGNNGEYLPDDTYYYILEIDNVQDLKGFLVIKR